MPEERQLQENRVGRFDQVRILTTKNVTYLSAPPGTDVSPKGIWSVTAIIGEELLLAKQSALIRIPAADVLIVAGYSIDKVTKNLGKLSHGKKEGKHTQIDSDRSRTVDQDDREGIRSRSDHEGSGENDQS